MTPLLQAIFSALAISLISFVGIVTLAIREKTLNKILYLFVSFSTGALLGSAFFIFCPKR